MEGKLKFHNAIGFSLFHVAEAVMYQFVNTYLLLYLTSVVLMDSDKAGMLVSIGMVFEFASSLIIGKLSDSCTSPKGRRRPFLLAGSVMVPVVLILLFTNYNGIFSGSTLMIPYLIINILFWISHGLIYIPFMALGSEITSDYDERTKLRSLSSGIGIVGSYLSTAAPLLLIGFLNERGMNDSDAWFWTGIMAGGCAGLALFVGWKLTAGVEKVPENGKFEPMKALKE
ncbi:MAG: MFS transporter, partial [Firmicutes bacterium]|nr:MFS transporter [Bacillota bacterium]